MEELVSIIMPSFNTAQFISASINSVLSQSYTNWELLIVDDCSTDNTDEIVKSFLFDNRINYFKNKKNSGAAISRNFALSKARGEWIAFLDSDDLWLPEKLSNQIQFMKENNYFFSYTKYEEIDSDGNRTGIIVSGPKKITKNGFYNYCWPGCLTVMYHHKTVGLVQISGIKKNNDYAMWLKACKKADCYLLDKKLAQYRRGRAGSISTQKISSMIHWHYMLFHDEEKQSVVLSVVSTIRNLVFGFYKKIRYVRHI